MSRGAIASLATPHPLGAALPGVFQEDDLTRKLTGAFDEVLAPILTTVDNFPAYLDPMLTPPDFLDWLAGWVGILLDETWPDAPRRELVARAMELFSKRGTVAGVAEQVQLFTGGQVQVVESGGVSWSATPGGSPPGDPGFALRVRVATASRKIDPRRVEALVGASKPAHVAYTVEIVAEES